MWTPILTWGAMIVNFLILMLLLRIFLYRPILKAIDQRDGKIAAHFEAAEEKEQEAIRKSEELDEERKKFDAERELLLAGVRAEAEKTRVDLTAKVRGEIDELSARWREDLERERESFLTDLERRAGEGICAMTRKALADLADAELERLMVGVLLRRLGDLPESERAELAKAADESGKPLVVATSWELPEDDRKKVSASVRKNVADDIEIQFEAAPEITCGIELRAGGREVSWTVEGYIQSIREELAAVIEDRVRVPSEEASEESEEKDKPGHD